MANILSDELFQKIRVNFLFNHPFLSVLALSIPTEHGTNNHSAFETNGEKISIDLEKLKLYGSQEITYLYAHTLLHIVLKHPYRQKRREKMLWNMSCDIVINNILSTFTNVGEMPKDELVDKDLDGKCVEEVYEILYKKKREEPQSGTKADKNGKDKVNVYDKSKMDLDDVESENEDKDIKEKLDSIIIQALSIAKKSSTEYEGLKIEIDTLIKPEIDLADVLKEFLTASLFEKEQTFNRPNKRFIHSGLYLPGVRKSNEMIEIFIALDSSSSVSLEEYKKFLGVVKEICEGFYEYKIVVLPFDKYVKEKHIVSFDSFNPIIDENLFIPKSDGGTDFDAVLRYLKTTDIRSENLLMVLTDGEFEITEPLVSKTIFIVSVEKNLSKFEKYGRAIQFKV